MLCKGVNLFWRIDNAFEDFCWLQASKSRGRMTELTSPWA